LPRVILAFVFGLTFVGTTTAQTTGQIPGMLGIGIVFQSDDAPHRTYGARPPSMRPMPRVEVGFPVGSRLGIDIGAARIQAVSGGRTVCGSSTSRVISVTNPAVVEVAPSPCSSAVRLEPSAAICNVSYAPCTGLTEREQETLLSGLVRRRLVRHGRAAFDVMGGAGLLIQHATTDLNRCTPGNFVARLFPECLSTPASTFRFSPAFEGGLDVGFELGPRAQAVVLARLIRLQRGTLETETEYRQSSFKAEVGLSIRGLW
jgi:hypothetical protein